MKKFLILFLALGLGYALASTTGAGLPWEGPLEQIKASLSGPVAFIMSILAIIGAGAGLIWGGELGGFIKTLIYIVLVIAIVVGAGNFMGIFNTSGALI
ncbi:TrbC/VirB2 family protein [Campylobacter coli]|uniref:TrbC/VirB2 family protein n=1 Tax=Campylobacter coli TaxID=195 RepID=UPI00276232A1|nr:TrbC/VirB2 family protein [Campylobacter coli]MDP8534916.1 TrbC/VirB2 family protein [Campylobacter coli]MDP8538368.1 TrbC/VirB2 family protein [Campylobacter coli]